MAGGDQRVLLGEIVAAHGIKGLVKVRTFTERPEAIAEYGPLRDASGRTVALQVRGPTKGGLLAEVEGVTDRNAAEALKGTELFVDRSALPPADEEGGEFYHADLVGLEARSETGERLGEVVAVQDFGAGGMLEVRLDGRRDTALVPFAEAYVPQVDPEGGYLVIAAVPGLFD
jgi:16S rRNA processing protein RimM